MRDCSQCPERVELHPDRRGVDLKDTPCETCSRRERADMRTVSYSDEVYYAGAMTGLDDGRFMPEFAKVLKKWGDVTSRQRDIVMIRLRRPHMTRAEIARKLRVDASTVTRDCARLSKVFPQLSKFLH